MLFNNNDYNSSKKGFVEPARLNQFLILDARSPPLFSTCLNCKREKNNDKCQYCILIVFWIDFHWFCILDRLVLIVFWIDLIVCNCFFGRLVFWIESRLTTNHNNCCALWIQRVAWFLPQNAENWTIISKKTLCHRKKTPASSVRKKTPVFQDPQNPCFLPPPS